MLERGTKLGKATAILLLPARLGRSGDRRFLPKSPEASVTGTYPYCDSMCIKGYCKSVENETPERFQGPVPDRLRLRHLAKEVPKVVRQGKELEAGREADTYNQFSITLISPSRLSRSKARQVPSPSR